LVVTPAPRTTSPEALIAAGEYAGFPTARVPHDHGDHSLYPWLPNGGVRLLPYVPARPERFALRPMRRRQPGRFATSPRRLHPDLSVRAARRLRDLLRARRQRLALPRSRCRGVAAVVSVCLPGPQGRRRTRRRPRVGPAPGLLASREARRYTLRSLVARSGGLSLCPTQRRLDSRLRVRSAW